MSQHRIVEKNKAGSPPSRATPVSRQSPGPNGFNNLTPGFTSLMGVTIMTVLLIISIMTILFIMTIITMLLIMTTMTILLMMTIMTMMMTMMMSRVGDPSKPRTSNVLRSPLHSQ